MAQRQCLDSGFRCCCQQACVEFNGSDATARSYSGGRTSNHRPRKAAPALDPPGWMCAKLGDAMVGANGGSVSVLRPLMGLDPSLSVSLPDGRRRRVPHPTGDSRASWKLQRQQQWNSGSALASAGEPPPPVQHWLCKPSSSGAGSEGAAREPAMLAARPAPRRDGDALNLVPNVQPDVPRWPPAPRRALREAISANAVEDPALAERRVGFVRAGALSSVLAPGAAGGVLASRGLAAERCWLGRRKRGHAAGVSDRRARTVSPLGLGQAPT